MTTWRRIPIPEPLAARCDSRLEKDPGRFTSVAELVRTAVNDYLDRPVS